ncbi:MAG: 2-C-methyl-D-erythritol 4-phosphate cytidylyltransferase, partial [Ruminiclostridium sp.]|nr:2-C-methyl-D-erythritol 4-phosphate cytidylyltransferase [Ruminiclostridium sp.]
SAQTPQAFRYEIYSEMVKSTEEVTDDAQLAERLGYKVKITEGSYNNIKITTPVDVLLGDMILSEYEKNV